MKTIEQLKKSGAEQALIIEVQRNINELCGQVWEAYMKNGYFCCAEEKIIHSMKLLNRMTQVLGELKQLNSKHK